MGTNAAPELANLYLYFYESRFIDRLILHNILMAQSFHLTFRLLDDVLSVDNSHYGKFTSTLEKGGIYPSFLPCEPTNTNPRRTNFCGIRVDGLDTCFALSVYDKKKDFPFEVVNYPHTDSNIPLSIAYSAFTGQLTRFYRLCNRQEKFLTHAAELTRTLLAKNGCSYARLDTLFRKFIRNSPFKFRTKKSVMLHRFARKTALFQTHCFPLPTRHERREREKPVKQTTTGCSKDRSKKALSPILLDPRDPSFLLTDTILHNIIHELRKMFLNGHDGKIKDFYPRPLNSVLDQLDSATDPEDHDQLIIPIIINGNHWTLLIIDLRPLTQHMLYFDSLGGKIDTRLQNRLTNVFPTHTLFVFNQQLQFDGFQCGVWVCFFISLVYERLRSGTDLSTIDLTDHSLHVTNNLTRDQKRHNSDFIADLRSTYTDYLLRAKAAGTLATSNNEE